jgi:hypothetical protein
MIKEMEDAKNQTGFGAHLKNNWLWYLGGVVVLLGIGAAVYFYFIKKSKPTDEEIESEE